VRGAWLVFLVAVGLYLPTVRHGFVQDDRAIVELNPAAHSVGAALRALDDPYWPPPSEAGLWRPVTIASFALDWTLGAGRVGWLHFANALWHGLAAVLLLAVVARWLHPRPAVTAALVFAVHPVHVEAVAGLVGRAEMLVATLLLGGLLAARRRMWGVALPLAAAAMLTKESGVVVSVAILLYGWLDREVGSPPRWFLAALVLITGAYVLAWRAVGGDAAGDVAAPFIGTSARQRLLLAFPAILRAVRLLAWPSDLSADYGPQVIAVGTGFTPAAVAGVAAAGAVAVAVWRYRRSAPHLALTAGAGALCYLPTSNLLFPSGVVLAERNLYVAVALPAVLVAAATARVERRWGRGIALALAALVVGALAVRSAVRLPDWRSNRDHLLALLADHPESARAHFWAAGVLGAVGDSAGARASYDEAIELYDRDPHVLGAAAFFYLGVGDSIVAADLATRARDILPGQRDALRVQLALALAAGDSTRVAALSDSIGRWHTRGTTPYRAPSQ
jgi:hypothetical protein